jgi:hypothetical protein
MILNHCAGVRARAPASLVGLEEAELDLVFLSEVYGFDVPFQMG